MQRATFIKLLTAAALIGAIALGISMTSDSPAEATPGEGAQQAVPVGTITTELRPTRLWADFSGRLQAIEMVEIRPQVSGTIQQVLFEEGALVKAGDPLFVIDPRPFEAAVAEAEAAVATARTQSTLAQKELGRAQALVKDKVISQQLLDERVKNARVAGAGIASAEAALKRAKLDLEYAHISAPISGRVSRAELTVGNLVEAGSSAPLLTTIVSNGPIYAEFDVDEQTYLANVRQAVHHDQTEQALPVELVLKADQSTVYQGSIQSFDNRLNTTSGTIRARAIFENEDQTLVPGMYATVRLGSGAQIEAIQIPDRAVGVDQDKRFVYVVGEDNKVIYRQVALGQHVGEGLRLVTDGLQPGEKVVVSGVQQIRPDMVVLPKDVIADAREKAANPIKTSGATQ